MSCACCAAKDRRIAELEEYLDGAVFAMPESFPLLARSLKLTPREAQVVEILYRSGSRFIHADAINEALPGADERKDAFETETKVAMVFIVRIRKKLGRSFVENQWGAGYRLSQAARERVAEILKEFA